MPVLQTCYPERETVRHRPPKEGRRTLPAGSPVRERQMLREPEQIQGGFHFPRHPGLGNSDGVGTATAALTFQKWLLVRAAWPAGGSFTHLSVAAAWTTIVPSSGEPLQRMFTETARCEPAERAPRSGVGHPRLMPGHSRQAAREPWPGGGREGGRQGGAGCGRLSSVPQPSRAALGGMCSPPVNGRPHAQGTSGAQVFGLLSGSQPATRTLSPSSDLPTLSITPGTLWGCCIWRTKPRALTGFRLPTEACFSALDPLSAGCPLLGLGSSGRRARSVGADAPSALKASVLPN